MGSVDNILFHQFCYEFFTWRRYTLMHQGEDEWHSGDSTHLPVDRCHTWVDLTLGSLFYTVRRISGLWRFFWWKIQDFLEPFPKQTFLFQIQDYNLKKSVEASSSHVALQTYSNTVPCGYKRVLKLLILQ